MSKKHRSNQIYSHDYYCMEKLINDRRFKERVQWLRGEYAKLNLPVPNKGFPDRKSYQSWINNFFKFYTTRNRDELAQSALLMKKDTSPGGVKSWTQMMKKQNELLPLLPNEFVKNTMLKFGFDPGNEKFHSFILAHIFSGQKHFEETPIKMNIRRNNDNQWELALIIFPHTTLEHVIDFWKNVVKKQNYLAGYQGKNRKRLSFERDLHIYEIYKKFESRRIGKRSSFRTLADLTQTEIEKERLPGYIGLTHSLIRKAVARIKELDEDPAKRPRLTGAQANLIIGKN